MPTIRQVIECIAGTLPQRPALFVISEGAFCELQDVKLPADERLTQLGYQSVVVSGVPVIWNVGCASNDCIPLDQALIDILARKD